VEDATDDMFKGTLLLKKKKSLENKNILQVYLQYFDGIIVLRNKYSTKANNKKDNKTTT